MNVAVVQSAKFDKRFESSILLYCIFFFLINRHGGRDLARRLSESMESNLAVSLPLAGFFEQCLYAHDSLYQQEKACLLRWKLRSIHQNKE